MSEPWWISLIKALILVNILLGLFAYLTLIERKVMGRMQLRFGPNRAGKFGLLQPIADLVKLVRKEAFSPASAIDLPYILAPVVSAFTAIAAFAFIPWGPGWTVNGWRINGEIANVSIGLIAIFALGSIGIYGFIVGGWASESKFSILGSMRTCAQLVSYEVSLALSVLGVVILGRSLNLPEIVARQGSFLPYAAPQFVGLVVFFFAGIAETSRAPFDQVPLYFAPNKSTCRRPVNDRDGYIGGGTKIVKYPFALSVFGHQNNPGFAGRAWRSNDGWFPSNFEASLL